jgi:hypothetical protein
MLDGTGRLGFGRRRNIGVCTAQDSARETADKRPPAFETGPSLKDALYLYHTGKIDAAIREYTQLETGHKRHWRMPASRALIFKRKTR